MIRTGNDYRASLRDGREVWMNGERVEDVTTHPAFRPIVDVRARIYDMAHEEAHRDRLTYKEDGEAFAVGLKLPRTQADWWDKRAAVDAVMDEIGGVVTRVGDETVGEMWSLYDGQDVLNEVDPRFSENIRRHIDRVLREDLFHVSANTDPKGDRSKRPQDQDPDMLLHVVRETDSGIVIRGAKYETAAAYANQAFVKPTIANWGDAELSDYALGCIVDMGSPRLRHLCRTGFAGRAPGRGLPALEPVRRGRYADRLRRRRGAVGERPLLPPHAGRGVHPRDAASLQRVPVRPADPPLRGHADRRRAPQRPPDRPRAPAGGAGEARDAGVLPRGDQRPSDRRDRARRAVAGGPPDAEPVAPLHAGVCWPARSFRR